MEWHVTYGAPAQEVLRYATSHQVDLIAMSTHGTGQAIAAAIGSVAAEVLASARLPLLPLKPDERLAKL